jgi:hypothetical protein
LANISPGDPLPPALHPELANELLTFSDPKDTRIISIACRLDIVEFLDTAKLPPATKLLLLIDDVHKMGAAAGYLCDPLLSTFGLRDRIAATRVRTVFTYSSEPVDGQRIAVDAIVENINHSFAEYVELGRFKPLEERLAYEHFLLQWRDYKNNNQERPLCVDRATEETSVDRFFAGLTGQVEGIPSFLDPKGSPIIRFCLDSGYKVLHEADDSAQLNLIYALKRQ